MTKEEAKEVLISTLREINSDEQNISCSSEEFTEAMLLAIDTLSKPSLPSNLDEAARKAALVPELVGVDEEHLDEYPYSPIAEQKFKEGAEWMAGQGEIVLGNITSVGDRLDVETLEYLPEESEFEISDKVIVQIRKKY